MISVGFRSICILVAIHLCVFSFAQTIQQNRPLTDKLLDAENVTRDDNHFGEFQLIQSNVLQIKNFKVRSKRNATVALLAPSQNATSARAHRKYKHDKKKIKKKKKKHGLFSLMNKMKDIFPKFMKKMMPMMKGPSMFMMGMAQANLNNFVMHALMMSKMALGSVIMMIIREMVFGDKDEPVKYYNFGYDPPRRRVVTTYDTYDYKRRRRRNL